MPERRKKKNLKSTKHHLARKKKTTVKPAVKKASKVVKAKVKAVKPVSKKSALAAKTQVKEGSLSVFDLNGKAQETVVIDPIFHEGTVNTDVIYQAVLMYQAGEREGTAATKDRGHVSGGGKKPWKQKGTGQARHGSRRSPIWRHGGVTFGPMPRDYSYSLPSQLRRKAVAEVVKDRAANGKLILVKALELEAPKTKLFANILETFKLEKPLFLVQQKSRNVLLASRNIADVSVKTDLEVNALDVASHKECVMTKAAYQGLIKRLKS